MTQNLNISSNTPPQAGAYTSYESSLKGISKRKITRKTYSNTRPQAGIAWSTQYK